MLDVLIVDQDAGFRAEVDTVLRRHGHRAISCRAGGEALRLLGERRFDVVMADVALPPPDGFELLRRVRRERWSTDVVLVTAEATVPEAVAAIREHADDYLVKPATSEAIDRAIGACERRRAHAPSAPPMLLAPSTPLDGSPTLRRLRGRIAAIAASDAPVLLTGESGTGKELVARAIHQTSARRLRPFVAINCAAFPDTLIEEELFGHERGAFTGAVRNRAGRFKAADGGTLFLDEVAELSPQAQAKLLRVLQEMTFEPLGSNTPHHVDVRVLSATHRDLRAWIKEGRFREDLYYRIKVLDVHLPSLRESAADLPDLVEFFLRRFTPAGQAPPALSPRAHAALLGYAFPGNLRELEHAVQHAIVLSCGGTIDIADLPLEIVGTTAMSPSAFPRPLADALREFEHEYLLRALRAASGVRMRAAALLGISRKTLWEKLRDHGISDEDLVD